MHAGVGNWRSWCRILPALATWCQRWPV